MGRRSGIFYSALVLTGVNLILRFGGTGFQVYLSGRIGAAGMGLLQLVLSVSGLAITASMAGIRTATMYLAAEELGKKHPENVTWVLSGCFAYSLSVSLVISAGLYHFAPLIASRWVGAMQTTQAIRSFSVFLPVICLGGCMVGYFTAANRIGTLAVVEIAEQVLSLGFTLLALELWGAEDPARACLCVVLGSGLGACLTLFSLILLRIREKPPKGKRICVARRLWDTAVPLALADDLKAGISTTENLMVPKRLALCRTATNPLASFGTVCGMVFPVLMFPAAIIFALAELLIPELARCNAAGHRERIRYLAGKSLRITMLYGCVFCGLMFLWARPLCDRLYGSREAGHFLRLYAPMIPMLYCDIITDAMTKGLGQQKACVRYNIFTSSLDVAFLYILLPRYGMYGYLLSFFVTHLINFLLSLRRLLGITKKKLPLHIALGALGCLGFGIWVVRTLPSPASQSVAFLTVLFCGLYLLRIITKEDIRWITELVKR